MVFCLIMPKVSFRIESKEEFYNKKNGSVI